MNPRRDFQGHEVEYRHFVTPRHSGLMPYHLKHKRGPGMFQLLLGFCLVSGCAALAIFVIQVLR